MTRFFFILAMAFAGTAAHANATVEEVRSEAPTREAATEAAAELAAQQCEGDVMTVGSRTDAAEEGFVAQVWYLCTPTE